MRSEHEIVIELLIAKDRTRAARELTHDEVARITDYLVHRCVENGSYSRQEILLILLKRLEVQLTDLDAANDYIAAPSVIEPTLPARAENLAKRILGVVTPQLNELIVQRTVLAAKALRNNSSRREDEEALARHIRENQLVRCAYCGYPFVEDDIKRADFVDIIRDGQGLLADTLDPRRINDICKPHISQTRNGGYFRWTSLEIEHVVPQCFLGAGTHDNLAISCSLCNRGKWYWHTWAEALPAATSEAFTKLGPGWGVFNDARAFFVVASRDGACNTCGRGPSECEITIRPSSRFALRNPSRLRAFCYDCSENSGADHNSGDAMS